MSTTAPTVQLVVIHDLIPTPDNPRFVNHDDAHKSLVESIRAHGVLQPLLARPHPSAKKRGKLDLRAGSRRLAAATEAGLSEVPVIVRDMDDREALEVTVTENLQREDLHPLEESRGIKALLDGGWDLESVASRLGKSARWVTRRAQLSKLIAPLVKMAQNPEHPLSRAPTGILERLASFQPDVQQELGDDLDNDSVMDEPLLSLAEFDRQYTADVVMDLRGAPWKIDDATLYPEAGACSSCPHRASQQPMLFEDLSSNGRNSRGGDRCTNRTCFNEKRRRVIRIKVDQKKAEHGDVVLIGEGSYEDRQTAKKDFGKIVVNAWDVASCKKSDPGAKPGVVVTGPGAGNSRWVRSHQAFAKDRRKGGSGSAGKPKPLTLKERMAKLDERRSAYTVDALKKLLEDREDGKADHTIPPRIDLQQAVSMLLVFLCRSDLSGAGLGDWRSDDWSVVKTLREKTPKELIRIALRLVCGQWAANLNRKTAQNRHTTTKSMMADVARICDVLEIDIHGLRQQALEAIPVPRSWGNLKADGTPKVRKETKKRSPQKPKAAKRKSNKKLKAVAISGNGKKLKKAAKVKKK